MRLIKPYYEILKYPDLIDIRLIEKAGRTCYKSEDKITEDSYKDLSRRLIQSGHEAVLEHSQITVKFVCDRGISHELVRHRLASFCQESTRYCNYSKDKFDNQLTFIIPCWIYKVSKAELTNFMFMLEQAEAHYFYLLNYGWSPGQARSILPNALKTEVIMTANVREWRHILKLRTSKKAHEQMRELMIPLLKELQEKVPIMFDDIKVED